MEYILPIDMQVHRDTMKYRSGHEGGFITDVRWVAGWGWGIKQGQSVGSPLICLLWSFLPSGWIDLQSTAFPLELTFLSRD